MPKFNLATLQQIYAYTQQIPELAGQKPGSLVVNTNEAKWRNDLAKAIFEYSDSKLLCLLLAVERPRESRVDRVFLIIKKSDLTAEFLQYLDDKIRATYIAPGTMLDFLERKWQLDEKSIPLVFFLSTLEKDNSTHFGDRAVAPVLRNKGVMKNVSLAIVETLSQVYGPEHKLTSLTMHPATYLFFCPDDKSLRHYDGGNFQESTCQQLLDAHSKPRSEPMFRR